MTESTAYNAQEIELNRPRPWPTKQQVNNYYRARGMADQKIGAWLSILHDNPQRFAQAPEHQTSLEQIRADITFWFEMYPECRH